VGDDGLQEEVKNRLRDNRGGMRDSREGERLGGRRGGIGEKRIRG